MGSKCVSPEEMKSGQWYSIGILWDGKTKTKRYIIEESPRGPLRRRL